MYQQVNKKIMNKLIKNSKNILGVIALMALTGTAFAATNSEDLGTIGVRIGQTITTWTTVVFLASAMIGLALCISGTLNIKKYSDNPQQNSWTKGAIYLIAGALCFFLAYSTGVLQKTIFGSSDANGDADYEFTRETAYKGN